jgi:hypothetical protein
MASHSMLQYLPEVALHEHIGCAHFSDSLGVIRSSYLIRRVQVTQKHKRYDCPVLCNTKHPDFSRADDMWRYPNHLVSMGRNV